MTKYTDLQDSLAAALVRKKNRLDKARRFCTEFSKAFAVYLNAEPNNVFFVKQQLTIESETGKIIPDDDPIEDHHDAMSSNLVICVDDTVVLVYFVLNFYPADNGLLALVSKERPTTFNVDKGIEPIFDFVFALTKTFLDGTQDISNCIEL